MAILRLNDGKHFEDGHSESRNATHKDRVYGHLNADHGFVMFFTDECKQIKKVFEPLYSNNLHFKGKISQEQKAMRILEAEVEPR
jgi:hypothetical protein